MKYNRIVLTLLVVLSCCCINSLRADTGFEAKVYQPSEVESLPYRIHLPEKFEANKKYPLVLFFHGSGERGNDNKRHLRHGAKDFLAYSKKSKTPMIIVAPQCPIDTKWVNIPWNLDSHTMPESPSPSMTLAIGLLKELQTTLPVDTMRIYVTGLSMGGFGTWDIIQRMPKTFAAAMPVCGGADTAMAGVIKDIPLWVFHGGSDTVVKTIRSRKIVAALKKVGSKVKYTEYENVGHNSWSRAYKDEEVLKWLFSQKNSAKTK